MEWVHNGPINPRDNKSIFVQRSESLDIRHHIANKDNPVAILSPRQTGKTTLLYQLQLDLHDRGYKTVYLDLSGYKNVEAYEFYRTIYEHIRDSCLKFQEEENHDLCDTDCINSAETFLEYILCLTAHTKSRKLIIMLDEIWGIPANITNTFFPNIRKLYNQGANPFIDDNHLYRKVIFIISGGLELRVLMDDINSPLYNICERIDLKDFSLDQVHFLANNLQKFSIEERDIIAKIVYDWCDGHPYLTQFFYFLIEQNNEHLKEYLSQLPQLLNKLAKKNFIYGNNLHK